MNETTQTEFINRLIRANSLDERQAEQLHFLAEHALGFQQELMGLQVDAMQLAMYQYVVEQTIADQDPELLEMLIDRRLGVDAPPAQELLATINANLVAANIIQQAHEYGFMDETKLLGVVESGDFSFLTDEQFMVDFPFMSDRVPEKRVENFVRVREHIFESLNQYADEISELIDQGGYKGRDGEVRFDARQMDQLKSYQIDLKMYRNDGGEFPRPPDFVAHLLNEPMLNHERQDPLARALSEINTNIRYIGQDAHIRTGRDPQDVRANVMFASENGIKDFSGIVAKVTQDQKHGDQSRFDGELIKLGDIIRTTTVADDPGELVNFAEKLVAVAEARGHAIIAKGFQMHNSGSTAAKATILVTREIDGEIRAMKGEVQMAGYGQYHANKISHSAYEALRLARNNYGASRVPEGADAALFEARYDQFVTTVQTSDARVPRQMREDSSGKYTEFLEGLESSRFISGSFYERYETMVRNLDDAHQFIHSESTQIAGSREEAALFRVLAEGVNRKAGVNVINIDAMPPIGIKEREQANATIEKMEAVFGDRLTGEKHQRGERPPEQQQMFR